MADSHSNNKLNLDKLLSRVEVARAELKHYEVLQTYKTIYFRCLKAKNFQLAFHHLAAGCVFLHEHQQWNDALDLLKLLMKLCKEKKVSTHEESCLTSLRHLFVVMQPGSVVRTNFVLEVVELLKLHSSSSTLPSTTTTSKLISDFYEFVGRQLWKERRFVEARPYLMRCHNGFTIGCFLVEIQKHCGYAKELDLFITQAVLQCLCMRHVSVANIAFYTYTRRHPLLLARDQGPPFELFPLLNFVWFLMLAIEKECDLPVFHLLCEKYAICIERDPIYAKYLQKIAILYFKMAAPPRSSGAGERGGMGGNNLFTSLFRLLGSDDNDAELEDGSDMMGGGGGAASLLMQVDDMD